MGEIRLGLKLKKPPSDHVKTSTLVYMTS